MCGVALLSSVAGQGYQAVADASDPVVLQHHEVVSFVVSGATVLYVVIIIL